MIDTAVLAAPITELLGSFGSGVVPLGGPADALRLSSAAIDAVHVIGRDAIAELDANWRGTAATAAVTRAQQTQGSSVQISERGTAMAEVANAASADVRVGLTELQGIARSFASIAIAAAPMLTTPAGLATIIAAAIEHLDRALAVVAEVRTQLSAHTARMAELTAPNGPVAADAGPGEHRLAGKGVEITLPDGSTAIAPNEQAATAVRAALRQQGVPYVWGGSFPGEGLDCSGLTKYAYGEAGIELPRLAQEQNLGHVEIDIADLMPGDLAVWDGHVAMVIGNGQFIEAGDPVSTGPIRTENCGMAFYGFYRPTS